jgi:hypothetical protein
MPKHFDTLKNDIKEWSTAATRSGAGYVGDIMSLRTGKSDTAKKPSVRQLKNKSPSRVEIGKLKNANWSAGGIT